MGNAIKGITVEIGGDTTKLGKALQGVNTQTANLQRELKGVNTLLKMDPGNVTLLAQKQDLLTQAINNTKEKLGTLKTAQEQAQKQFEKGEITEEQYRDLQREIVLTEQKLEGLTNEFKEFGSVGAQQVAVVGEKVQEVGGKVEKFGKGFSTISAGAGAILAGSVAAFVELDSGYDTIITKTGATGDALEGLNSVADNIFGSMPTDMDTVGVAVGEINTRFGYTGDQLEDLSTKFIQFAEINGVDLNTSIGTVDKVLEQFNMDASESGDVLDLVTLKAQQTGIGADTLLNSIQQNGATFKDMGIGVNEAVVLLSQFEANGVNVDTALKGLKKSTVEYAKEGLSMEEGLAKTIDSIKNAKTETEALAEVEKIFGAKGANEMVKAIREGRLSVDDLSSAMGDYSGVVSDTFNATLDPIDQGKVAMNNLKLAGSELGGTLQTTFAPMLTTIVEKLQSLVTWFSNLSPTTQTTIVTILSIVTALGPLIIIIGKVISSVGTIMTIVPKLTTAFTAVKTAFSSLGAAFAANPIGIVIVAVTALVAAFIYLWNNCEGFRNFFINLWENIKNAAINAWNSITEFFTVTLPAVFTGVIDWIKANWQNILLFLINPFAGLFKYFYENNTKFKEFVDNAVNFIKELPGKVWTWLTETISKVGSWISDMIAKAVEVGTNFVSSVVTFFKELPGKIWTWLTDVISKVVSWGSNLLAKGKETATNFVNNVVNFIKELPGKIWTWLTNVVSKVATWGGNLLAKGQEAATKLVNGVVNFVKGLPGKVWTWLTNVVSKVVSWGTNLMTKGKEAATKLVTTVVDKIKEIPGKIADVGKNLVEGIWNGISESKQWIKDKITGWVGDVTGFLKGLFGIQSPSTVMRDEVGKMLGQGIAVGIDQSKKNVTNSLKSLVTDSRTEAQKVQEKANETMLASEEFYASESLRIAKEKEEQEYQQKLANAKDAEEVAKIKAEREKKIQEEADQAYLDGLKKTAEEERKLYDARLKDQENFKKQVVDAYTKLAEESLSNIEELQKTQESFAKKLSDYGSLTSTVKIESSTDTREFTTLADLDEQNETLEHYRDLLLQIKDRENVPQEFFTTLRDMSVEEGISFAETLLKADETSFNAYIEDWKAKQQLANDISKTLYEDEANALGEEILNEFDTLTDEMFGVGTDFAAELGEGFMSGFGGILEWVRENIAQSLSGLFTGTTTNFSGLADVMSITIPQAAKGGIVNRPTFLQAGEDGAEAIMPLENNTGWIDNLAQKINSYQPQSGGVVNSAMLDKLDSIYERLGRMQMVTDTGALVGEILDKIDTGLAEKQLLNARGV